MEELSWRAWEFQLCIWKFKEVLDNEADRVDLARGREKRWGLLSHWEVLVLCERLMTTTSSSLRLCFIRIFLMILMEVFYLGFHVIDWNRERVYWWRQGTLKAHNSDSSCPSLLEDLLEKVNSEDFVLGWHVTGRRICFDMNCGLLKSWGGVPDFSLYF